MEKSLAVSASGSTQAELFALHQIVQQYLGVYPAEIPRLAKLQSQLSTGQDILSRHNMAGHVTSSALVLDANLEEVLLIHHRASGLWLPPGGHYEGPGSLLESARRELAEETGLAHASPYPTDSVHVLPMDIDSHPIPARPQKNELAHWHHDFAYLMVSNGGMPLKPQAAEVLDAQWVPLKALGRMPDGRLQRLQRKTERAIADQRRMTR